MTPGAGYYVEGVRLVGLDGLCDACGKRKAVGHSVSGLAICQPCARDATDAALEMAREVGA